MSEKSTLIYCSLDGNPCLTDYAEAWLYKDAEWKRISLADIAINAQVIGSRDYAFRFGILPVLPPEAFAD